jgi:type II secretory pathway predicted ATPase ExeA
MEGEDQPRNDSHYTEENSMKLQDYHQECDYATVDSSQVPENHYATPPSEDPPPLPISGKANHSTGKAKHSGCCRKQKNFNTFLIAVLIFAVCGHWAYTIYTLLRADDHATTAQVSEASHEYEEKFKQLNTSNYMLNKRLLEVEGNLARLNNFFTGAMNEEDSISLLHFVGNLTAIYDGMGKINASLQDHISSTDMALVTLQRGQEELSSGVTQLENSLDSVDSRLLNLTMEAKQNTTFILNSQENLTRDLGHLEMDTNRNLNFVNSSLREHIASQNSDVRENVSSAVNEIRSQIESEISSVREDSETGDRQVKRYVDIEIADVNHRLDDGMGKINASLQDHISSTDMALVTLQRGQEELSSGVTQLENSLDSVDSRLLNLTMEAKQNTTFILNSQENLTRDLGHLEMDTNRNLNFVNSSLREHIASQNSDVREDVSSAVNEIRSQIESEISSVREDSETGDRQVKRYVDIEIADVNHRLDDGMGKINASLQDHISSTDMALVTLQRGQEELSSGVTQLENSLDSVDSRLLNLTMEAKQNTTFILNSQENLTRDLGHLEMDTNRNLNFVNSSLREHIASQNSDVREDVSSAVNEIRSQIESEISSVREDSETRDRQVRQYVDIEIVDVNHRLDIHLRDGAATLQSCGLLITVLLPVTHYIIN